MDHLPVIGDRLFSEFAIASAACALLGGLLLAIWLRFRQGAHTGKWPMVEGVVLECGVVSEREDAGQLYRPVVRYRYEVGGRRFEADQIRWGEPTRYDAYTQARRRIDGYRSGRRVRVYYDPSHPGEAVLQPSAVPRVRPLLVIAPMSAMYVLFLLAPWFAGH
jgi:hypothetical protein